MARDDGAAGGRAGCRVSTRADAVALWGAAVVDRALNSPEESEHFVDNIAEFTDDLTAIAARARGATSDAGFARWALTLPWPRFVALVRLVAGETRRRAMTMEN